MTKDENNDKNEENKNHHPIVQNFESNNNMKNAILKRTKLIKNIDTSEIKAKANSKSKKITSTSVFKNMNLKNKKIFPTKVPISIYKPSPNPSQHGKYNYYNIIRPQSISMKIAQKTQNNVTVHNYGTAQNLNPKPKSENKTKQSSHSINSTNSHQLGNMIHKKKKIVFTKQIPKIVVHFS